jgi:hypothetical protein
MLAFAYLTNFQTGCLPELSSHYIPNKLSRGKGCSIGFVDLSWPTQGANYQGDLIANVFSI